MKKLTKQPKIKAAGIKINKKYTNSDSDQKTRMAKEVKQFSKSKGNDAYDHIWTGDSKGGDGKTTYKTKKSKHTKAFEKKFG